MKKWHKIGILAFVLFFIGISIGFNVPIELIGTGKGGLP